jgi:hypothetical protein
MSRANLSAAIFCKICRNLYFAFCCNLGVRRPDERELTVMELPTVYDDLPLLALISRAGAQDGAGGAAADELAATGANGARLQRTLRADGRAASAIAGIGALELVSRIAGCSRDVLAWERPAPRAKPRAAFRAPPAASAGAPIDDSPSRPSSSLPILPDVNVSHDGALVAIVVAPARAPSMAVGVDAIAAGRGAELRGLVATGFWAQFVPPDALESVLRVLDSPPCRDAVEAFVRRGGRRGGGAGGAGGAGGGAGGAASGAAASVPAERAVASREDLAPLVLWTVLEAMLKVRWEEREGRGGSRWFGGLVAGGGRTTRLPSRAPHPNARVVLGPAAFDSTRWSSS